MEALIRPHQILGEKNNVESAKNNILEKNYTYKSELSPSFVWSDNMKLPCYCQRTEESIATASKKLKIKVEDGESEDSDAESSNAASEGEEEEEEEFSAEEVCNV